MKGSTGTSVRVRKPGAKGSAKVKFGSVTICGARPSAKAVKDNVARSAAALERASKKLMKPGVVLPRKKDVPRFSVSEDDPNVFIRRLNGREERGRLVNGSFRVID